MGINKMESDANTISVVMCAYTEDRWSELGAAIGSLRVQSFAPAEIILVCDHNPVLFERAREEFPDVRVVENHEPLGLSGARNSGIEAASGELLAFMDEDAVAAPDWLENLQREYADPQVLAVGGAILPAWQSAAPHWFPEEFLWVVGCTYKGALAHRGAVRNLIGCNMSFRRTVFDTIGGFRSGIGRTGTLPVGCEETELCIRLMHQWPHHQILYQPAARVFHRVHQRRANWNYFLSRCYAEGLSKALVTRLVGERDGLSSERSYTFRALPLGAARGVADALLARDSSGLARSAAIVTGLMVTAAGYLRGRLVRDMGKTMAPPTFPAPKPVPQANLMDTL
jgi:glucosyl-dolichyl phosphate glucuronosyltransferase